MTDDEYNESKEDTVEQLKEFNERLSKITAGDMTIHDKLSIMRLVSIKLLSNIQLNSEISKIIIGIKRIKYFCCLEDKIISFAW